MKWTPEEDAYLRDRAGKEFKREIAAGLPGRSHSSVVHRLRKLQIRIYDPWTDQQDATLRELWGYVSIRHLTKVTKRRPKEIRSRAFTLGLTAENKRRGIETIYVAAKRTGFDPKTLKKILDRAGVPTLCLGAKRAWRTVLVAEVDAAVARYMSERPLSQYTKEVGLDSCELRAAMLAAIEFGVIDTKPPARNSFWRVTPDLVQRAVAWRSSLLPVAAAAYARRIHPATLKTRLRRAGVRQIKLGRGAWYVLPEARDMLEACAASG